MVTRAGLDALLNPRSFALIGASDKSTFSLLVHGNLDAAGHRERTFLVNPRSPEVHGRATYPSCVAIGMQVDLAFVMVPAARAADAIKDAAAAGARAVMVLSSGYAETGPAGRARQEELVELADSLGVAMLGPNVLGLVNVTAGIPAMALSDPPTEAGGVALISQSGASCGAMKDFASMAGVNLSHVITVGNEAMVTVAHLLDHLVDDDSVRAVAIFMEAIREPALFAAAARRAARQGKAIVVLKAGRSELAARAAASHTGALVGDDRVVDAVFADLGVIRVDTIEDMLVTAGIAATTGRIERPGIGVVSISGGACDIIADLAEGVGAEIPELTAATTATVAEKMPDFGHAHNPLDVTGAALIDTDLWEHAIEAVGNDESIGTVVVVNSLPWREDGRPFYGQKYVDAIGRGMKASAAPALYVTQVPQPIGTQTREVLRSGGVPHVVPGMRAAVEGIQRVVRWSRDVARAGREPEQVERLEVRKGRYSEVDARGLLEQAGVPVVPALHVHSAAEAEKAAASFDGPVAMKIVSADVAHKSDIGGVRLGVTREHAGAVHDEIVAACAAADPDAVLDGVLVSPMRAPATELLVGVTRSDEWGPVLAVAFGGVLVEVLDDAALAPLPVDEARVRQLLTSLRGAAVLDGVRGRPAADLDSVCRAVVAVGRLAERLGNDLESLEVNPLRVHGSEVEALDGLVLWRE
ncbi:acetate--CoA ligase family protein [Nocardioides campestrisoli]|uniref:acetate--CoA ligase family protein n=1 Tax=Nocardioides campestrisoli TaxID=2736757 RepID=UPI0015E75B65|nr:acetate--CoA ligase family protein [Nocardioides campestrisoli]